jgi:hypothetical protein
VTETWSLPSYGLDFNTGVADAATGCVFWVTEDAGWRGGAAPRPTRTDKPTSHGQYRRPNYKTGLKVSWNGYLFGADAQSRALGERKLATIGADAQQLFEVRCTDSVGALFSMMELDGPPLIGHRDLGNASFSLQFAAPDPRRYVVGQTIGGSTTLPSVSGGLDWSTGGGLNWSPGLDWGTVTSLGQITFVHTGTAPTDVTFTLSVPSGTLVNPQIMLLGTGQRLHYTGTLVAGDSLVINTSEFSRSVVLNGSTDVRTRLDTAQWFQIPTGSSVVNFAADNVNAAATLSAVAYIANW